MQYACDAGEMTWFRLETEGEAALESQLMDHAVEKYFIQSHKQAMDAYRPPPGAPTMEQNIGRKAYVARVMPRFLTLRDADGTAHVTAMLPAEADDALSLRPVIVGVGNSDPYAAYGAAIEALGRHIGMELDRQECFPYRR